MKTVWTKEHQYLISLVKSFVHGADSAPQTPCEFSWTRFQEILNRHPRVLLPLGALLYESKAPWETKTEIAAAAQSLREHTDEVLNKLPVVVGMLDEARINFLLLKGPALSRTVYRSPELRFASDLDFLVRRDQVDRICTLLKEQGYSRPDLVRSDDFYDQFHFHRILQSPQGTQVEIHWDLTDPEDFVRFDLENLWKRKRKLAGSELNVLHPADALLHMVSQSMPGFESLGRLIDVALLVKAGALEDTELLRLARQQGIATPLWMMLRLASEMLDLNCDDELIDQLDPGWPRNQLLKSLPVAQRMVADPGEHTALTRLLQTLCTPNFETVLRRILRIAFPGTADIYRLGRDPKKKSALQRVLLVGAGMRSLLKMTFYLAWRTFRPSSL